MIDRGYRSLHEMIAGRIQDKSVLGQIALWDREGQIWFPGLAAQPPAAAAPRVPAEWKRLQPGENYVVMIRLYTCRKQIRVSAGLDDQRNGQARMA